VIYIVNLEIQKQNSRRIETELIFLFSFTKKNQKATFISSKGRKLSMAELN